MPQIFPKWSNTASKVFPFALLGIVSFVVFVFWYWFSPKNLDVGYRPAQPINFSHKLHVSDLQIDCMFCHRVGELAAPAGVPDTQTCMVCHEQQANKNLLSLSGLMQSWHGGMAIPWKRVTKVADYAYFDHSAHISAGVGCISCHGQVNEMQVVRLEKPLSMGFCLDCHRNPAPSLRPVQEVTNMHYQQTENDKKMAAEKAKNTEAPDTNCSGCHR